MLDIKKSSTTLNLIPHLVRSSFHFMLFCDLIPDYKINLSRVEGDLIGNEVFNRLKSAITIEFSELITLDFKDRREPRDAKFSGQFWLFVTIDFRNGQMTIFVLEFFPDRIRTSHQLVTIFTPWGIKQNNFNFWGCCHIMFSMMHHARWFLALEVLRSISPVIVLHWVLPPTPKKEKDRNDQNHQNDTQ